MIAQLKQFFESHLLINGSTADEDIEHKLKLTSAVLLLEMMHVDLQVHEKEERKIHELLQKQFDLCNEESEALIELAHHEKMDATDYYQFTSLINEHYSQQQKRKLVEQLWHVAYADGEIDKFEEHLLRKLAELLHVPHKHFIQTKHRVLNN